MILRTAKHIRTLTIHTIELLNFSHRLLQLIDVIHHLQQIFVFLMKPTIHLLPNQIIQLLDILIHIGIECELRQFAD